MPESFGARSLLVALLLSGLLVLAAELFWRDRGIRPTAPDNAALWARERDLALEASPAAVAVLGSSRVMLGIDPDAVQAAHPGLAVHQVAVYGSSPMEIFRHLAEDSDFAGLLLIEFGPIACLDSKGKADAQPKAWVAAAARRPLYSNLEMAMRAGVHLALAARRPNLTPIEVLKSRYRTGELPQADHVQVLANRHIRADFSLADRKAMTDFRLGSFQATLSEPSPAAQEAFLARIERLAGLVQSRGGQVVFVRMPSDGATWDLEERTAPRWRYWDRVLALPGLTGIHFRDEPELAGFKTGDGSHLDQREAETFSRALFRILEARGLLPAR